MGDYRTTTGEDKPLPARERRRRRLRLAFWIAFSALAIVAAGFAVHVPCIIPASGYVTTEEYAEVRASIPGTVREIRAVTGNVVTQGQMLVQLDDAEQTAAMAEARSLERKASSELARREIEITQQKKTLQDDTAVARLRAQNAKGKLARIEELQRHGLAAAATVDDYRLQADVAQAELEALQNRNLSAFDREIEALRHEVASREDQVAVAEAQVRQRKVCAPISGHVLRYDFVVGELIKPETIMYEIFGGRKQVLKLRIDERFATQVRPGQRYRAHLASYNGLQHLWFEGHVADLRNVIQVDGPRTYRAAYCEFDSQGRVVPPGTTAEARIYAGTLFLWAYVLGLY